jgi:hypothetical protein
MEGDHHDDAAWAAIRPGWRLLLTDGTRATVQQWQRDSTGAQMVGAGLDVECDDDGGEWSRVGPADVMEGHDPAGCPPDCPRSEPCAWACDEDVTP